MVFVTSPTATHVVPLQATPTPPLEKKLLLFVTGVQSIPLEEYAMVFNPFPTATHLFPLEPPPHATS
jgi:hypothetical protein